MPNSSSRDSTENHFSTFDSVDFIRSVAPNIPYCFFHIARFRFLQQMSQQFRKFSKTLAWVAFQARHFQGLCSYRS